MNGKERVRRALAHEPVDRVPIGFFAIDFDTVERILGHETYLRAKAKSQIAFWEGRRDEVVQSWKEDTIELYRKLEKNPHDPVLAVAYHKRFADPIGVFVLLLLALPFALNQERANLYVGIGLAVLVCFLYILSEMLCRDMGNTDRLRAVAAAWLPNLVFGPLGIFLFDTVRK